MIVEDLRAELDSHLSTLLAKLRILQNSDGGFKAYHCHDTDSGVWATAEIVHTASKGTSGCDLGWLREGSEYLLRCQNSDGGWPFRRPGIYY
jgi:hypothetical protein